MADQESQPLEIPGQNPQEEKDNLFPLVCDICKEKNLTTNLHFVTCLRCSQIYCVHFASSIDPSNCTQCCSDVTMTDQTIVKKTEHYNEDTDKVYTKTSKARQIQFSGLDWLFYQRRIRDLNDTELALALEYHRGIYNAMIFERDQRRAEYAHRNAGKKLSFPNTASAVTKTTTTTKKTKTIKATATSSPMANIAALLQELIKQGKTKEEIMSILGGRK